MALMPYMQWTPYTELREKFWKIIDTHRNDSPLRCMLYNLAKAGLVEKKYEGAPPAKNDKIKLTGYLYVRRISRTVPRNVSGRQKKLDGTFGLEAAKQRARQAVGKKRAPKTTVKNLTMDDVRYIRDNPHNLNGRELSEMFGCTQDKIRLIKNGHIPAHLREQPVQ